MNPVVDRESIPFLQRLFGIDIRALAALRIGLGILLLLDFLKRSLTLEEHYSDDGVLAGPLTFLV